MNAEDRKLIERLEGASVTQAEGSADAAYAVAVSRETSQDMDSDLYHANGTESNSGEDNSASKKRKAKGDDATADQEDTVTKGLSRQARKLQKKLNKKLAKKSEGDGGRPCFMLSRDHNKLSIKDLRDLVVYLLTETKTLPWIMVKNKFNIEKVVMLYVPGLDPQFFNIDLHDPESNKPIAWAEKATEGPVAEFQHLRTFFDVMSVMKAGGDKYRVHPPVETLLSVPLSNSEKAKREQELKSKQKAAKSLKPENYMLSLQELREGDFPLPSYLNSNVALQEGWIETERTISTPSTPKKMIAMDCEMCRTTAGSEVTRISLINEEGETVYDHLIMPDNAIVDYLTQYSGMTAERLEGVTTRLVDAQKKLQELITYDTILVGHSLENDMKVLKFAHPFIIDTSVVYHHLRGPPFRASLRWLTQKWLSRRIQQGGKQGHDSVEDAQACMDLAKLKIQEGPGFGEFNQEHESIFSRIARYTPPRSSAVIDCEHVSGQDTATVVIKAATDVEVVKAIPAATSEYNFVWACLRDLEINHGRSKAKLSAEGKTAGSDGLTIDNTHPSQIYGTPKVDATEEEVREAARNIDSSIAEIVRSLPENTALIVTSGQGDLREVIRMQARQRNFQRLYNTLNLSAIPKEDQFLDEDQQAFEKAVDRAKNGVCFFMVK
ncbi:hypothetical protein EDD11_005392 [Mortierella claussenii]|nr:hypothetical protein EDD11_005392 [Mortierella claussenii]